MDERPDQIINHIEAQRHELGRNLNELETRVRENADWRTWFDRNPMMMMGAALGGGLLLGTAIGGKTPRLRRRHSGSYRTAGDIVGGNRRDYADLGAATAGVGFAETTSSGSSGSGRIASGESRSHRPARIKSAMSSMKQTESWHEISETMDTVRAALITFGLVKAKEFLTRSIPGFDQHLEEAQSKRAGNTQGEATGQQNPTSQGTRPEEHDHTRQKSHLYTPSGEQVVKTGSWSNDPVGTFTP